MSDETNYTRPEDKARWGFGGSIDEITMETPADSDAPKSVKSGKKKSGENEASHNGGGNK